MKETITVEKIEQNRKEEDKYKKNVEEKKAFWIERWKGEEGKKKRIDMKCDSDGSDGNSEITKHMLKQISEIKSKPVSNISSSSGDDGGNEPTEPNIIDVDEPDVDLSKIVQFEHNILNSQKIDLNCALPQQMYGEQKLNSINDKKNDEQCKCDTFIPTGIFTHDWKYFRRCYQNFKIMIIVAEEKDISKKEKLKTWCRKYFMDTFYNNFGGEFEPYLDIMLKFAIKHEKLCALNRHIIPGADNEFLIKLKIKAFIKGIEKGGLKDALNPFS